MQENIVLFICMRNQEINIKNLILRIISKKNTMKVLHIHVL